MAALLVYGWWGESRNVTQYSTRENVKTPLGLRLRRPPKAYLFAIGFGLCHENWIIPLH